MCEYHLNSFIDPNQLPPTVISQAATVFSYEQSLFQRIQKANPDSVQLLSVQYRMHPEISVFPNHYFYGGRLTDDSAMSVVNARLWHHNPALPPYRFFDIHGQERNQVRRSGDQGTSKSNELEAKACVALVSYLCSEARDINVKATIFMLGSEQLSIVRREDWHCDALQGPAADPQAGVQIPLWRIHPLLYRDQHSGMSLRLLCMRLRHALY